MQPANMISMNKTLLIVRCCVCKRVRLDAGWRHFPEPSGDVMYSHGYCPKCYQEAMLAVDLEEHVSDWKLAG